MIAVEGGVCKLDALIKNRVRRLDVELSDLPPPSKKRKQMPEGERVLRLRKKCLAPSQVLHYGNYPLNIVRGSGQYFYDENGEQYLDTTNNVAHVGHCHPKVVEAGATQMSILCTNSRFLNDRIVTFAKRLCATFPEKLCSCFFTNSGSEANDLALQIAQTVTGHSQIICLEGAYHGHLMSLKQLSTHKMAQTGLQKEPSPNVCIAPLPDVYRGQYRDPETAGELYAEEVRKIIEEQHGCGNQVSAFIHESMLSCAGQIVPPKGYLKAVYDDVHAAGGLCIADEIQVGFGRIGKHFWSFQSQGVCPDIVTLGKPMGNGHPVSAVVTTKEIAEKFASSGVEYFNTFGGNPVSMAIADAVLSVIEEEGLCDHAEKMGSFLLQELDGLKAKHMCIGDVRGEGLFIGVDLVTDRETREPDMELAKKVEKCMLLDHQIIVLADGIHGNVIKLKPPLCISKQDCSHIIQAVHEVLTKLTAV